MIASISYLHKARERWRAKEVEGALHLFELIRTLGQLTEQLPEHVDDLQIVNGIQAVFDGRLADARQSFEGAKARAEDQFRRDLYGRAHAQVTGVQVPVWRALRMRLRSSIYCRIRLTFL